MGARFDGFSIREYTSKMRSIDVFKCWPFTSTSNRQLTRHELHSWLPPLSPCPRSNQNNTSLNHHNLPSPPESSRIHKNGYTSEESSKSKSDEFASPPSSPLPAVAPPPADDEKLEMICPVCREFNAATLTAVNAHIDGCLAESVRVEHRHMRKMNSKACKSESKLKSKLKLKSPKKRSIAEIFKVEDKDKDKNLDQDQNQQHKEEEQPLQNETATKLLPCSEDIEVVEDIEEDEVSITVKKFRWLSRRLEALRSKPGGDESVKSSAEEEKLEMICPVCRDFNAATVTAVNAHIDNCLAQAVRGERRQTIKTDFNSFNSFKSKPKAPKKRSIAEILNAAPSVEISKSKTNKPSIVVDEDEDEDEDKSSDYSGDDFSVSDAETVVSLSKTKKSMNKNSKKKKTKKPNKKMMTKKKKLRKQGDDNSVLLNNEKKTVVNMKKIKKKKKKNIFNNELTGKKVSAYKPEVQTAVNSCKKLRGTIGNEMVALQDIEPSVRLNGLSVEKKPRFINCDSVGKRQKPNSPVGGTFKNHLKHLSGKISDGCKIRDGAEESHVSDQVLKSDIRVKFSYKDEKVGPKKRTSFDETMFNTSSDALATSFVKYRSSGTDDENSSFEGHKDKREEFCPLSESKQFSSTLEQVKRPNFLKPCIDQEKSDQLEQKSELLTKMAVYDNNNSQLFDGSNTTMVRFSPNAGISKPFLEVQQGQMCGENTQMGESGVFSFGGKFIDYSEDHAFQVDAVNKNASTETFLEPSSSYSAPYNKVNERLESTSPSSSYYGDNAFPVDMTEKSYPFTSWGQGCIRNSCMDPNFFGLPLNSHGELINFSSSGNVVTNQLETSSPLGGSLSGLPSNNDLCRSSPENLSMNESHVVQKSLRKDGPSSLPHSPPRLRKDGPSSLPHSPPRLSVTELYSHREDIHPPNSEMFSSHHVQPQHSEFLKHNSYVEQNQCETVQNHNRNGMVSLKEGSDHISLSSSQPTVRLMGKDVPIARSNQETQKIMGDVWTDEESRRRQYADYTAFENSLLGRCSKQDWVSGSAVQISTNSVLQSEKTQSTRGSQSTPGFPRQFFDMQSNHVPQNGSFEVGRNASSYINSIAQESTSYAVFNGIPSDSSEQFITSSKPSGLSSRPQALPTPCNFNQPTLSRNAELNERNKNPHVTKSAFGFPFLQPAVNEQAKTYSSQGPYRSLPPWLSNPADDILTGTYSPQFSGVGNQSFPQNRWGNNFATPSFKQSAEFLYPSNPLTSGVPTKTTALYPQSLVRPPQVSVTSSSTNIGWKNINKDVDRVKLDNMSVKDHHPCTNIRKRSAANLDDSRQPIKLSNIEVNDNKRTSALDPQVEISRSRCCPNVAQNINPTSYPATDSFKPSGTIRSSPVRLGPKRAKHILNSS